ncbi:hypothetical protein [Stenotrophomonas maltophilia]|uniref:hypothetical protein n=1 Tax=Stenotrophomonas maltophilia TaxID=40324 RepID=UPI0014516B5D|nr:hypothetical protein [Stenotrophomonas maltophilia]QJC75461.1 hypothetical protein HGN30_16410 [Stenotrophomonas maltophilia]
MNTNNKTLADVQPGGRVRLGDALLPCPLCGNDAEFVPYKNNGLTLKCKSMGCIQRHQRTLRYGIEWLRTSMTEHWNTRALAARQPVGQGDALRSFACEAVEYFRNRSDVVDGDYGSPSPNEEMKLLSEGEAALAARQPVGALHLPPDGFYKIVYDDAEVLDESFARSGALDAALRRFEQISARWNAHLFVRFANNTRDCTVPNATPAQAVDLGLQLDRYDAGLLGDGGGGDVNWWQDYIRAELDRAHEFYQDQADSQAAGK